MTFTAPTIVSGPSRTLDYVQRIVSSVVKRGDLAIDATAGNGHDTLFLARLVGPTGLVLAIDIQREAVASAAARIESAGLADRVSLILGGHEDMRGLVTRHGREQQPSCIMFNLGYLPGSDKSVVTRPDTTLTALEATRSVLKTDGILTVVVYPAHSGGREEARSVDDWMAGIDSRSFGRVRYSGDGAPPGAAYAWIVRRLDGCGTFDLPPTSSSS